MPRRPTRKAEQQEHVDPLVERIAAAVKEAVKDPSLTGLRVLKAAEVARILDKSKSQLEEWRAQTRETGKLVGPPYMIGPSGKADGYPIVGLIDYIVRNTVWGDFTDKAMSALATVGPGLEWETTRSALVVLMPIVGALGLPAWSEERELLIKEGWVDYVQDAISADN